MRSFLCPLAAVLALAGQLLASPPEASSSLSSLSSSSSPPDVDIDADVSPDVSPSFSSSSPPIDVDIDANVSPDVSLPPLNTTTDLALSSSLESRSDCDQTRCPDSRFGFDVFSYKLRWTDWLYGLRWRGVCGCHQIQIFQDGCKTFNICSGVHSVCMDWRQGRAHWVDPGGVKRCYTLLDDFTCGGKYWTAWPKDEVDCTW